ncbi:MAG: hypothetical protein ACLR0N_19680 [Bilophila wadsworthia]
MQEAQSADFYFTVVFQNQKAKDRFLMEMGVPVCEQFVNGDILSRRFGVDRGITLMMVCDGSMYGKK